MCCYRLHDLVAIYARETAEAVDPPEVLTAALTRVLYGRLAVVNRVAAGSPPAEIVRMHSSTPALTLPPDIAERVTKSTSGRLSDEEAAQVVGVERAAALGLDEAVCDFVSARSAVEQAGRFVLRSRILSESRRLFGEALGRFRAAHDVRGQAAALAGLGIVCREPGYLVEALHYLDQAPSCWVRSTTTGASGTCTG